MNTTAKKLGSLALAAALVSIILLHSGCASPSTGAGGRRPGVHPGIIVLTAEQARNAGFTPTPGPRTAGPSAPQATVVRGRDGSLLRPPVVRAYQVGRYRDPADPRLLHEAHTVYRIEEDGDWELDPGAAGGAVRGDAAATTKKPGAHPGEGGGDNGAAEGNPQGTAVQAR
jgi:hypothetical protein